MPIVPLQVLTPSSIGSVAVRNRFIDVTLLTGAAVALIVLATTIPDMPV